MSDGWSSATLSQTENAANPVVAAGVLAKLVYRSRAVQPLSPVQLQQLAVEAQSRNRIESITGVVLYDDSRFFQWLEGPAESLDRIMRSIRRDPRHTDIEVLENHAAEGRLFSEWNMKLATPRPGPVLRQRDVIEPPDDVIEELRQHPEAAPVLLVKLMPASFGVADSGGRLAAGLRNGALRERTEAILASVFRTAVIPAMTARKAGAGTKVRAALVSPRMAEFAELLLAVDEAAPLDLIRELEAETGGIVPLYASLFEPAARRLGDLWSEDLRSEFEVTLALCRLQSAVRLFGGEAVRSVTAPVQVPLVLIAPEPGEIHRLGAAMDSEVMWDAGWAPHSAYPTDDRALQDIVSARWFDVLDLSLSATFRREDWLPRMARTIASARRASRNPALVVVVGGRVFVEEHDAGARVGADVASKTSGDVDDLILSAIRVAKVNRGARATKTSARVN
jgi:hypothetical protein